MSRNKAFIPNRLKPWIEARRRWHLSHAHIQMARELGLNPEKLGKIANHRQEPWKLPLPEFIADLYVKRFGNVPDVVKSIEEIAAAKVAKRQARKLRKLALAPQPQAAADPSQQARPELRSDEGPESDRRAVPAEPGTPTSHVPSQGQAQRAASARSARL